MNKYFSQLYVIQHHTIEYSKSEVSDKFHQYYRPPKLLVERHIFIALVLKTEGELSGTQDTLKQGGLTVRSH